MIDTNIFETSEDPLLRSGLIFAGANYAWQNGNNPYEEEDGMAIFILKVSLRVLNFYKDVRRKVYT